MDNKNESLAKIIIGLITKTLLVIASTAGLVIISIAVIAPQSLAGFAQSVNLVHVRANMLEKVYLKTHNLSDLERAIDASIEAQKHEKTVELISLMQNNENYFNFVIQTNEQSIRQTTKENVVFVCDYDAYLNSQKTAALFKAGRLAEARSFALAALENNLNPYSWELGALVDSIKEASLSENDKKFQLTNLYNSEVENLIEARLSLLGDETIKTGLVKLKTIYAKLKINLTRLDFITACGQNTEEILQDIDHLIDEYNQALAAF